MFRISKFLAALVVPLAIYALATPSFAQRSEGQITSSARAAAIRDCTSKAGKLKQYTWGDAQIDTYRACMAQHGQRE
jgi:hypothetical protein